MSERFEWAHASAGFRVVGPDELDELADDGNDAREWGVAFSTGSNGCMIYGSPAELRALLLRAHNALPVPDRTELVRGMAQQASDRLPRVPRRGPAGA